MVRDTNRGRGGFKPGARDFNKSRGGAGPGGPGGRGGFKGKKKTVIEPHILEGVFIARGDKDSLLTKSIAPGENVYGEKKIQVEVYL